VGYILGVSPGFSQMGQGEERLINMGLARKIVKAARLGFDFTEIDYEALSEMYEPYVDKLIKHVKEVQNMEVGLHLPVKVDLCIANAFEWKEMHEILRKGAYSAREVIGAKFFLFHTSSRIRPHVTFTVGHQEHSVQQNSFSGMNLGQWMSEVDKGNFTDPKTGNNIKLPSGKSMQQWFKARFTKVLFHVMGLAGDVGMLTFLERHEDFRKGAEEAGKELGILRDKIWFSTVKNKMLEKYSENAENAQSIINSRREYYRRLYSNQFSGAQLEQVIDQQLRTDREYNSALDQIQGTIPIIREIQRAVHEKDLSFGYQQEREKEELMAQWVNEGVRPDETLGKLSPRYKKHQTYQEVIHYVQRTDFDKVFDFWTTKGSECEEQVAYRAVAKYMYWIKDPIWMDIVGDYDPDSIIKCADLGRSQYNKDIFKEFDITGEKKHFEEKKSHSEKKKTTVDELVEKMITAVACKYIEGHLYVSGDILGMAAEFPEFKHLKDESVYKYTKDAKMMIFIETSMPPEGQEGELRIMSAHDHVTLVKHLDKGEITGYTMDFEHLTVNFVRVTDDIKSLKEGDAKYIKMMHINAPRPIIGAHAPIPLMSHDMFVIYEWLFDLRKKGMKNAYFIWEMGGFGIDQSAIAFRNMVIELAKGTGPKDLPQEFYGIDDTLWAAQHVAIRNHGLDPLKGMIMVPEVDHGVFSKAAHEKGKAKEWEEEKYKY
ncbi:MAG: hypothetical protein KJ851_06620, partial [Nanoarchaeota archaeon]|nr:hypothetical protein [Nanoarchaeota archaeon]